MRLSLWAKSVASGLSGRAVLGILCGGGWLFGFAMQGGEAGAAEPSGLEIKGDSRLFDGNPETGIIRRGGGKAPVRVREAIALSRPERLTKIVLRSKSGNRFWQIREAAIFARGSSVPLVRKRWYDRPEKDPAEKNEKFYELTLEMPDTPVQDLEIELVRIHPYLHMQLAEAELYTAHGIVQGKKAAPTVRWEGKNSRFFFPIGTCFSDSHTADYGFSAVHSWRKNLPEVNGNDIYGAMLDAGIVQSTCINHVPWLLSEPEEALKMRSPNGKKGRHHTFHLPEFKLRPDFVERAKYWNGRPGFYQYVYNNEICYVGWLMGDLVDFHPYAIAAFQQFLRQKYGTIATLNQRYGNTFSAFDQVEPPRAFKAAGAAWGDWMQFRMLSMKDYAEKSYRALKEVLPDTVLTPKPISANEDYYAASKGIDPWMFREACDVYGFDLYPWHRDGFYSVPMSCDFQRTQIAQPLHCTESGLSYSTPFASDRGELVFNATYWPGFLRGIRACYWFEWYAAHEKKHRGYWLSLQDGVLTPLGEEAVRMAKTVQTLAPVLNTGTVKKSGIAIFWPWHDVFQTPNVAVVNAARGAYKLISQRQYLADMISYHNIDAGELAGYRVLVLPWSRHLPKRTAENIRRFVADGGVLIADMGAGRYDEDHQETSALNAVLGIAGRKPDVPGNTFRDADNAFTMPKILTSPSPFSGAAAVASEPESESITAVAGAKIMATFPQGEPALIRNSYGKGVAWYFAAAWFAANRNFFYTMSSPPAPSSLAAEMKNRILPQNLALMDRILREAGMEADLRLPEEHFSWMDDGRQYIIFSAMESRYGDLFGLTNWGPRPMHSLPVEIRCGAGKQYAKVYYIDTMREERRELPFQQKDGILRCRLPNLAGTGLLLAVTKNAPVLAEARYDAASGTVRVSVRNGLERPIDGRILLRMDGSPELLAEAREISIAAGGVVDFRLKVRDLPEESKLDPRGFSRKWYVWGYYDGNARFFEPVR